MSPVGGSVSLLAVVSASSEIAVVSSTLVLDVPSVGGSVLMLIVVSASETALAADMSSVRGSVLLLLVVSASPKVAVVTVVLAVDLTLVGGSVLMLSLVSVSEISVLYIAFVVDVSSVAMSSFAMDSSSGGGSELLLCVVWAF